MMRAHLLLSVVCAVVCLVAWPARGEEVPIPQQAITDDVFAVVWLDAEHFATLPTSMEQVIAAMPEDADVLERGLREKTKEAEVAWRTRIKPMVEAGFRGELQVFRIVPDINDPSKTRVVRSRLARVSAGTTVESFLEAQEKLDYVFYVSPRQYDEQWLDASSVVHADAPTDGTTKQAAQFRELFANTDEAAVRIAFRMTDELKAQLRQLRPGDEPLPGPFDALREPVRSLLGASENAEAGWLSLQFGEQPRLDVGLRFTDEAGARRFVHGWDALLASARRTLGRIAADAPADIDAAALDQVMAMLKLETDGRMLQQRLGQDFITRGVPVAVPLAQAWLMGERRPEPAPAPAPEPEPAMRERE